MKIISGENLILKINLFQSNGTTPLLISSTHSIVARIKQTSTIATYTYGTSPQIRQGDSTSQIEIEITQALSALLKKGSVYVQLEIEFENAEFEVDDYQKDISISEAFKVQ